MSWPASKLRVKRLHDGQSGFTIVELMVVVAVMAVLAVIAIPSFNSVALSSKLNAIANNFVASAQLARSEAIKRNMPVTLCASDDGAACGGTWTQGWIILAGDDVLQAHGAVSTGFQLSGMVTTIQFQPSGVGATAATLTACRYAPEVGSQSRIITLSATGRPGVEKDLDASACP
jgi:type IV fimbrial biogenesis protein FimT